MNNAIGPFDSANGGVFSRGHALDCGETDRTLLAAVRDGSLVRLRRGMYVAAKTYQACDDVGRHLLLARAVLADQRGRVALTHISAAALHGFVLYGQDLSIVHLVRLDGGSSRSEAGVTHHRTRQDIEHDVGKYRGLLAVSPARTVWEVACRSSLEAGVVTADSALHQNPRLALAVEHLATRFDRFPGSCHGRTVMRLATPKSDSPGESVTRVQFYRFGIPMPESQYRVYDQHGELIGIADFGWNEHRHLGEFDGRSKYEKFLRPGESPSDSVVREKRREDRMRAGSRGMTRFTWASVMPRAVRRTMTELQQSLEQSRRLYVRVAS